TRFLFMAAPPTPAAGVSLRRYSFTLLCTIFFRDARHKITPASAAGPPAQIPRETRDTKGRTFCKTGNFTSPPILHIFNTSAVSDFTGPYYADIVPKVKKTTTSQKGHFK